MAESTLSITRTQLRLAIARELGEGRDLTAIDADFSSDIDDVIDKGCRQFYSPIILPGERNAHSWSFMRPLLSFTLNATQTSSTVTIVDGVVTLASGSWPTWAASGVLVINNVRYSVAARTSATVLALDNTTLDAAAGTSYSLQQDDYDLPDLFGGFVGRLAYAPTSDVIAIPLQETGIGNILDLRQRNPSSVAMQPKWYATHVSDQTGATGTRWTLSIHPASDTERTVIGEYFINPYQLTADLPYPMGGQPHAETLLESCLAAAEVNFKGGRGEHYAMFLSRLAASVSLDRQRSMPGVIGYNGDPSCGDRVQFPRHTARTVTYNGQSWIT